MMLNVLECRAMTNRSTPRFHKTISDGIDLMIASGYRLRLWVTDMAYNLTTDKVVDRLLELSRAGKVVWQETVDERAFAALLPKFTVAISRRRTGEEYTFRVVDERDRVVEEATISEAGHLQANDAWDKLRDLHELARRSAVHADEAVSDLLASLEQIR
jgi:hypothetical protein